MRRSDPELMDAPGLPEAEVAEAYHVLGRVNRQLGNRRTLLRLVRDGLGEHQAGSATTLLDLGSGSGDLAGALEQSARSSGMALEVAVLDRDHTALGLAAHAGLAALRADALRLPLADRSIDILTAVKFAHHFEGRALERLLSEMARVARRRVVVLDIERHWLAYAGFVAWSRVFTRNRLVRYDGPLSVLRGFTRQELEELPGPLTDFRWTVRRFWPFQLALIGKRQGAAAPPG